MKKFKQFNESVRDHLKGKSEEEIQKLIDEIGFEIYGIDLEEKGNFGQDLTDIYVSNNEDIFRKIGQYRAFGSIDKPGIFYPDFENIEDLSLNMIYNEDIEGFRQLIDVEKSVIVIELNRAKKFGGLMDNPISYLDLIKQLI